MNEKNTKVQLIDKLTELRHRITELEVSEAEHKKAEERVKESEEKFCTLFESIADGVIVTDLTGTVVEANDGAAHLAGCSNKEELIGRNAFEFVVPQDRALAMDATKKTLEEGLVHERTEYRILTADGREIDTDSSAAVLYDSFGNPTGIINVVRGITRRKRLERKRKELERKAQLNSHLASVGEMAAGFVHEINNPLTATIGFAQLLLKKDLPKDIEEYVSDINEGAQRAVSIVRRMLIFAHQAEPLKTCVDINALVKSTISLHSYELKTNSIDIATRLASDLPPTLADASQLQEVFINIIMNAETEMKLAHGRGKLLITTKGIDDSIRISFQDDGPGIAEENLDKIFEPFFTTRETGQGTGLGLSICHRIVAEHDGSIYAKNKPGQGATFIVELPLVAGEKQPELAELSDEPQKVAKAKILVMDDEPEILKLLNRILTDAGHKVETIDNCSDALQKIKSERYHLILLDVKMPGMSGIELYQHIKKIDRSLASSVVFITADIIGRETTEFLYRTKVPYITKPFDIGQVEETVTRELSRNIIQP